MFILAYNVTSWPSLDRGRAAFARALSSLLLNSKRVDDEAEVDDDDDDEINNDAVDSWRLDGFVEILIGAIGLSESIGGD